MNISTTKLDNNDKNNRYVDVLLIFVLFLFVGYDKENEHIRITENG